MGSDLCREEKRREKEINWVELQYVMSLYVVGINIKVKKQLRVTAVLRP